MDIVEPKWKKSSTDMEQPSRAKLRRDSVELNLAES
jgi:hypothetical protein